MPDDLTERAKELLELIPLRSCSKDVVSAIKSSPEDKSIGIACSGGADSTLCVLLVYAAFPNLRKRMIIAHFNHQLRGKDSDQDESFVQELSKKLNLRCVADKANQKSNKADENSLRNLRMNFWKRLEQDEKITHIIQGHHLNDVAETLLWRIPRGVSVDGLTGPKPVSKVAHLSFFAPLYPSQKNISPKHLLNVVFLGGRIRVTKRICIFEIKCAIEYCLHGRIPVTAIYSKALIQPGIAGTRFYCIRLSR